MRAASLSSLIGLLLCASPARAEEPDRTLHSPGLAAAGSVLGTVSAVGLTTGIYFAVTHEPCAPLQPTASGSELLARAACVGASDVPAELGIIGLIAGGASFLAPAIPMMIVGYWPRETATAISFEVAAGHLTLDVAF